MLDSITIRNFKLFEEVEIELGQRVVFVGPNNSGKTSALQAIALWELGLRRWFEKRGNGKKSTRVRYGSAINRRDLVTIPVSDINHLWRGLHLREVIEKGGKKGTRNIRIEIEVRGTANGSTWTCGLEFDYANSEVFYCRPLRSDDLGKERMEVPSAALDVKVAYLQPMSGLISNEVKLDPGAVQVRLGEGRTAEVLRNLCYRIFTEHRPLWLEFQSNIKSLFGMELLPPDYIAERGEITMKYRYGKGPALDLTASGRGAQQTMLLLAFLTINPNSIVLLDEPDAHLEFLRQRQIYRVIAEVAERNGSQFIAGSHSEVLLNEAADRDVVIAFVGKPHRIDDRGSQTLKALKEIGFEHYLMAEQKGWVLYLEGSTDLAILQAFARKLDHPVQKFLERPFVHYVGNQPSQARHHFFGLREAKPDLEGIGIFDQMEINPSQPLGLFSWQRRELENYICFPEVLEIYARQLGDNEIPGPLFQDLIDDFVEDMKICIQDYVPPAALRNRGDSWWKTVKATNEYLDRVFADFFLKRKLPNLLRKTDYHTLAQYVPLEMIDEEIAEKLDAIQQTARKAEKNVDTY